MRTPSQHCKENFPGLNMAAEGIEGRRKKHVTFPNIQDVEDDEYSINASRVSVTRVGVYGLC